MASLWHPFAEMAMVQHQPFIVDRGEGIYVFDETGKRYLDAAASLWYMNVGYGRDEIIDAMDRTDADKASVSPVYWTIYEWD